MPSPVMAPKRRSTHTTTSTSLPSPSPTASSTSSSPFHLPPTLTVYDFSLCTVEVIFSLLEFILSMLIIKESLLKLYHALHPASDIPSYNHFLIHLLVNAAVMAFVGWRLASRLGLSVPALMDRLGLDVQTLTSKQTWGRMTVAIIALHTLGFAGMVSGSPLVSRAERVCTPADAALLSCAVVSLCTAAGESLVVRAEIVFVHQLLSSVGRGGLQHVRLRSCSKSRHITATFAQPCIPSYPSYFEVHCLCRTGAG